MPTDVLIDLTAAAAHVELGAAVDRWRQAESIGGLGRRITCAVQAVHTLGDRLPSNWQIRSGGSIAACADAMTAAAEVEQPLLVVLGSVYPSSAAVGMLIDAIASDPMIGFAIPRLTGAHEGSVACLDSSGDGTFDELPRRVLAEIPATYLVADVPARCLLIKPIVLANFGGLDGRFDTLAGALWHYMTRARRSGFRTLVCNRAVIADSSCARPCPPSTVTAGTLPESDRVLLRELSPDVERTLREYGPAAAAIAETRLARALPKAYGMAPSLLLDLRNIIVGMNGTTHAALRVAGGLHALASGWDVSVLAAKDAAAAHRLDALLPGWKIAATLPDRQFTAALRLSQPWHIQEMVDLHTAAAFNTFFFLDTISWDITYPAPRHLHGTWQFMADHADGLLFNSAFTRDRFRRRFRVRSNMPELVAYHSFDPREYVRSDVGRASDEHSFIFVVGNQLDHKDVDPTTELLAAAFPYEQIIALGASRAPTPRVKVLESGRLSDRDIHALYAGARVVVFPSFYEGFGFPVVTTLAYGGTLVARHSALLEEIVERAVPRGRVVPFTRRDELVEIVGRILHGQEVATLPMATRLRDGRPITWQDVGQRIHDFLTELTADLSRSCWRSREHTISQLAAAPMSLADHGLTTSWRAAQQPLS